MDKCSHLFFIIINNVHGSILIHILFYPSCLSPWFIALQTEFLDPSGSQFWPWYIPPEYLQHLRAPVYSLFFLKSLPTWQEKRHSLLFSILGLLLMLNILWTWCSFYVSFKMNCLFVSIGYYFYSDVFLLSIWETNLLSYDVNAFPQFIISQSCVLVFLLPKFLKPYKLSIIFLWFLVFELC